MKSVGIRGSVIAAVATIFVLGHGAAAPAHAQQTALSADAELAAKGEWNSSVAYAKDDIVTARGSAWIAKRANTNKVPGQTQPSTATFWQVFARGFNPTGAWLNSITYQPDELVTRNGETWRAKRTNVNKVPAANQFWELFAAKGDPGPNTGIGNGTTSAPSISFSGDSDTGIFHPAADKIALVEGGQLFLHNNGSFNTALGFGSLQVNTGTNNGAFGTLALGNNSTGGQNTAIGSLALFANTTGSSNTAVGTSALAASTTGQENVAVGSNAMSGATGSSNTAFGHEALQSATSNDNAAFGRFALRATTSGTRNTALGANAMATNSSGSNNVAIGTTALVQGSASLNVAVGDSAMFLTSSGTDNVAVGAQALSSNSTGSGNIAIGSSAAINPTVPANSIFIGNAGSPTDTTTIKIGTQGTQTSAFMAGIRGITTTANDAIAVLVSSTGQLGTVSSSRRYKTDIESMADVPAMLGKLRPVTFRYKQAQDNGAHPLQYGLIAEEVANVFPDLAVFNADGSAETVKYHLLPSFLLAGYQAQQNTIATQAEKIESQTADIADLKDRLRRLEALLPQTKAAALQ